MYLYWIKKQKLFDRDIGEYTSYGIGVCQPGHGFRLLCFIPDVCTDGRAVLQLALRCTLGQLAPEQLMDVVEDFIG